MNDKDNIRLTHIFDSSVEWQAWKDMRNILIHQYFGVDYKRVYLVDKNEIPDLMNEVSQILKELEN